MIEFEISEPFEHTPERILDALTDLEGYPAWRPDFVKLERLGDDRYGEGTAWIETRLLFGHEATEHVEVAEITSPERLVLRVDGSKGTARRGAYCFTYSFVPEEGGTRVTIRGEGTGLGTVERVVGRFLVQPFERACRRELRALRRWLDG